MPLLSVENLTAGYGRIDVLHEVSLDIHEGEIVALLGANGAGKTTLLRAISGLLAPKSGSVRLRGEEVSHLGAERLVERGIVHVPEHRQIFGTLTVRDNLLLGTYAFRRMSKRQRLERLEEVYTLFPLLKERQGQLGGTLSGGQQQMLAIGRAMMAKPAVLLLDEPSLGLSPLMVREVLELVRRLRDEWSTTVLLVEQNVRGALRIADRAYVLQTGRIVLHGRAAELVDDPSVQESYLGRHPRAAVQ
ncbi:MAG TPA: ABC transporter ATP-binding protein [Calditerricola sp.]